MANTREHRVLRRGVETYLDGEADASLAVLVHGHVAECSACSADAEWLFLIKTALRQIAERRPPELTVARLRRYASTLSERP